MRNWRLDAPATSPVWAELSGLLALGCARDAEGDFWSPSLTLADLPHDPFEAALVVVPGARLHAAPDEASAVLATLDWDLLHIETWHHEARWQHVGRADGLSGYVATAALRSPVDFRAAFRRIGGHWRMTVLIAGD